MLGFVLVCITLDLRTESPRAGGRVEPRLGGLPAYFLHHSSHTKWLPAYSTLASVTILLERRNRRGRSALLVKAERSKAQRIGAGRSRLARLTRVKRA